MLLEIKKKIMLYWYMERRIGFKFGQRHLRSDWLQFWTAASSFDIKGNMAIKKKFVFLTNRLVFPIMVTYAVIYIDPTHHFSRCLPVLVACCTSVV